MPTGVWMQVLIKIDVPDDGPPFVVHTAGDTPKAWQRREESSLVNVAAFVGAFLQLRAQERAAGLRDEAELREILDDVGEERDSAKSACPASCGYGARMAVFEEALGRSLNLETTRSSRSEDAHRDMDGFDVDEDLARLRRAVREAEGSSPKENPELYGFIAEAFGNIDESLRRLGSLPEAWTGTGAGSDPEGS